MATYYEVLGISRNATSQQIKDAYRKLVKLYHPDMAGNQKENYAHFQMIQEAYTVLSDSYKRSNYDQKLIHTTNSFESNTANVFERMKKEEEKKKRKEEWLRQRKKELEKEHKEDTIFSFAVLGVMAVFFFFIYFLNKK